MGLEQSSSITSGTTVQSLDTFGDNMDIQGMDDIVNDTVQDEVETPPETNCAAERKTRTSSMTQEERGIMAQLEVLTNAPKSEANNASKKALVAQLKPVKSKRLANMRVTAALQKLALVENLTTSQYEFSQDQKNSIMSALTDAVVRLQAKFDGTKSEENSFKL